MSLSTLKDWWAFISQAPASLQILFVFTFWTMAFLTLVKHLVRSATTPEVKTAYDVIRSVFSWIFNISKAAANTFTIETNKALMLPKPYPRVARITNRLLMIGMYAASIYMLFFGSTLMICIFVFSHGTFLQICSGIGFSFFILLLGRYYFVQAEKMRLELASVRESA